MRRRIGASLVLLALIVPSAALAAPDQATEPQAGTPIFDTPAPTAAPAQRSSEEREATTPRPEQGAPTPEPTAEAIAMVFDPPLSDRPGLHVGYTGSGVLAQAPLLVAEEAGYFDEVGLTQVTVARSGDVLEDVRIGDLDIGVVGARDALAAFRQDPSLHAIAGYGNYAGDDGAYAGEVLLASSWLTANEPATVLAFLSAYIRALQLMSDDDGVELAYDLVEDTDLVFNLSPAGWDDAVAVFEPFDGGFGALDDERGLGELARHLSTAVDDGVVDAFIDRHTLAIAQTWQGLDPNPANDLAGPPGLTEISIATSAEGGAISPIPMALEAGYFTDAGFGSVQVVEVDEPLLGILRGEVEFGVMDLEDVAGARAQGLPLLAVAGYRNRDASGAYGDDVLTASADLLVTEPSTVSAFIVAYERALADLREEEAGTAFEPWDGGFGERSDGGGLGALDAYLEGATIPPIDAAAMVDVGALEFAQAWRGLPANPVDPAATDAEAE